MNPSLQVVPPLSLSQRRGVDLQIIAIPFKDSLNSSEIRPAAISATDLGTMFVPSGRAFHTNHFDATVKFDGTFEPTFHSKGEVPSKHPSRFPKRIVAGLWIAIPDAEMSSDPTIFTHTINLLPSKDGRSTQIQTVDANGRHKLTLQVPEISDKTLRLDVAQIFTTRDFLSLALPYVNHGSVGPVPRVPDVCVLVTTTPDLITEATVAVLSYLAYVTRQSAQAVLARSNEQTIWTSAKVCKEVLELVDRINKDL